MATTKKKTTKKAVAAVAAAATIATACTPMQNPSAAFAEKSVRFSLSGVLYGDIATKTDPTDIFAATAPTSPVKLTLQSKTVSERRYTVNTGESITLPLDTYTVTGAYAPAEDGKLLGGAKVFSAPPFTVEGEVTVTEDVDEYAAPASYDCIAIVLDTEVCPLYRTYNYAGSLVDFPHMRTLGSLKVAYVAGPWTYQPLVVVATPIDPANQEAATHRLVSDANWLSEGITLAENGKWYRFAATDAQMGEGGIVMGLPAWVEGN